MKKPLISVIIPMYNHALYIEQSIESIVNQTYGFDNIELIVIDDCSTDNSVAVVKKLQEKSIFQLIINTVNKGICSNINHCLSICKGKYVCITASDDYWCLDKLELQTSFMEKNSSIGVCSGNAIRVDSESNKLPEKNQFRGPERTYDFKDIIMRDFPFSSTLVMIRKSVLDEVGPYDATLKIDDYYMWLKISHAGYGLHLLENNIGFYRIHNFNTIKNAMLIYKETRKIIDLYKNEQLYSKAIRRLKIVYFPQIALTNKFEAIRLLPQAISNTLFFYRGLFNLFKF